MYNIKSLISKPFVIVSAILLIGFFLRTYQASEWFMYGHDQDLLGWFIRDVVENRSPRLLGQQTSQAGVFIGPLFYYSVIPFYLLANWDPLGGLVWIAIIGTFAVWSTWYVFTKIFGNTSGYIASFMYASAYALVLTERELVPTTPVMLWSVWFLYSIYLLLHKKQKLGFVIAGVLIGLIWHLNLGLALLVPLIPLSVVLSKTKINVRAMAYGTLVALLLLLPFIIFEIRHGFIQVNAILSSGTEEANSIAFQFGRVIELGSKNIYRLYFAEFLQIPHIFAAAISVGSLAFLSYKRIIEKKLAILIWLWIVLYIFFFSFNSIWLSEYYLSGLTIIWIAAASLVLSYMYSLKGLFRITALLVLAAFACMSFSRFVNHPVNQSGYLERRAIVQSVKSDASERGYDCVSFSFITSPGTELGYRYFIWMENLKTKPVSENVPVYTVVYPPSLVDRVDKTIGALGLIYPDYEQYNDEQIAESCEGENWNTTYPLFGYTE